MSAEPAQKRPPVFRSPPHFRDPTGALAVWLTRPSGMVIQYTQPAHGTEEMARFVVEQAWPELEKRLGPDERCYFLHDYNLMTGYDPQTRQIMTRWGFDIRPRIERVFVLQPPGMNKVARMGIRATAASLAVIGIHFDVVDSLDDIIAHYGLQASL